MKAPPSVGAGQWLIAVAAALAGLAYLVSAHLATAAQSRWAPFLMLTPLSLTIVGAVAYAAGRWLAAVVAVALVILLAALEPLLKSQVNWLYVLEHVGFNLALCGLFAHTLTGGREPLITRLARTVRRGVMPAHAAAYTRRVTLAWSLLFAAIAATSLVLFLFAPLAVWSLFANLIAAALTGTMFVAEYLVRLRVLSDLEHSSIFEGIRAFRRDRQDAPDDQGRAG